MPTHSPLRSYIAPGLGLALAACAEPAALVPLLPPDAPSGTPDSADTAAPAQAVDLAEMPLPPGRTLWSWDIVGEAQVTPAPPMQRTGSVTWIRQNVSTAPMPHRRAPHHRQRPGRRLRV